MDHTRYRRPSAGLLLGVAGALVATGTAAFLQDHPGGLVLLGRIREHLVLLGWLALAALTGAVLLGLEKSAARIALCVPLLVLGIPFVLMAGVLSGPAGPSEETRSESAPGRTDRRLVVEEGSAMIDPLWSVYVHEGGWPLERRWPVGHFNGDDPDNELREVVWTAPDRIRMTTAGGQVFEVTLAPGGRPDRVVSAG
ncbi:hypothetical protein OTB20_02150 [Streptomyces sp. H27-H1]|uniref:hypothetical protein n=1 Tax=Streptomyces sp. H27-H1 TaxID=2996461 RepID=UPI00226E611E|nr:hypothetical protein [Streptomyces sp. H27-H1]MCY0925028.1 hypothetical protein [Streptomyces sp. H27-H1]